MPDPVAHTIRSHDGLALRVWDYGGAGPPLLLCHCTGTLGRIWDPIVARLGGAFRCIAPDTRGQGDSERPPDEAGFEWRNSGQDLLTIVDALRLGPGLRAAGHSAGGAHLAYAETLRPGAIARAVLIDPIIGPRAAFAGERPLAKLVRNRVNDFASLEDARARYVAKPPMNTWTDETVDAYLAHAFVTTADGRVHLKCPGYVEAIFYNKGGACDVFEQLESLDFDGMLVTGSESNVRGLAEHQHSRLPRLPFRVLEGGSHFVPQEQPEAIAELLRTVLD